MDKPEIQGCSCKGEAEACCSVEALVSVDERGQMVLPKGLREKAGIQPGDKLAATAWEKDGAILLYYAYQGRGTD